MSLWCRRIRLAQDVGTNRLRDPLGRTACVVPSATYRMRCVPFLVLLQSRTLPAAVTTAINLQPADWAHMPAWQKLAETPLQVSVTAGPQTYLPLNLQDSAQRSYLSLAPTSANVQVGALPLAISLPRPDGEIERFQIWEIDTFEPALAAQFPTIKTYRGQGIDDPTAIVAADMTEQGFHARVFRSTGGFTIEPITTVSTGTYQSFFDSDYIVPHGPVCQCAVCLAASSMASTSTAPKSNSTMSTLAVNNGATLRTFKLAVASAGEYTAAAGGTVPLALSAITTVVNAVNAIYERDFCVHMNLVANENLIIYTSSGSDPYTGTDASKMLNENHNNLNVTIGSGNYDIGHVFGGNNQGGVAFQGVVGDPSFKGKGVSTMDFTDAPTSSWMIMVASHEMGHQFGTGHTFNGVSTSLTANRQAASAWEPGSGSTIMAYAHVNENGQQFVTQNDSYFHSGSIDQVMTYLSTIPTVGTSTATGNDVPTITFNANKSIPANTPFQLTANATDGNGTITYTIEELDAGAALSLGSPDNGSGALFRSYPPTSSNTRIFPNLTTILANTTYAPETLPSTNRTMVFRALARDNKAGGGAQKSADVTLTVVNTGSSFAVTSPNTSVTYSKNSLQTITWNVAGTTANGINTSLVDIYLSTDGGLTFPTLLAGSTSNDGTQAINLPNVTTSQARIKVQAVGNYFFDVSNVDFSIVNRSMTAALSGNDLIITDADAVSDLVNSWSVTFNGTNFTVSDATEQFVAAPSGGSLSNGNKTLTMPAAAFTGRIFFNGNGGADTLTVNHAPSVITRGVVYNGGNPTVGVGDKLVVTGGSFATGTHTFSTASSGTITLTGAGTIQYGGLEPVDMRGMTIADLVFNLPATASDAILEDFGSGGDTFSQLRSNNATFELTSFSNPTNSLTINRGNGGDSITVNAVPDLTRSLIIGSSTAQFGPITFAGTMTLAAGYSLAAFSANTISLPNSASDLATSGSGTIGLTTSRNISLASGSSIVTGSGALTLSANQQVSPTTGSFVGIELMEATIDSTAGAITLNGRGGTVILGFQIGVSFGGTIGSVVGSGTSGPVVVTGTGGANAGANNYGVFVGTYSKIASASGNVSVTGTGGGTGPSDFNSGIEVNGTITAGGSASVTVQGTGGATSGKFNIGVHVADEGFSLPGTITSSGGPVSVTGQGGGNKSGAGVGVDNGGTITAGASGTVNVQGTSSSSAGTGNAGVSVTASGVITSSGGTVSVTGISTNAANSAVYLFDSAVISSGGSGNLVIMADSLTVADKTAMIKAGASGNATATIRQRLAGTKIDLGGADVLSGSPLTLGLTDTELDQMFAGMLQIGDGSAGAITISADITRPASTDMALNTNAAINLNAGLNSAGGSITLTSVGAITQTAGIVETSGTLTLATAIGQTATFVTSGNKAGSLVITNGVTCLVNGSFLSLGAVQVDGTLGGGSSVGTVTVTGTGKVAPGTSPGKLTTGNIAFNSGSIFSIELNGAVAGVSYDQLAVVGTVNLGGATLSATLGYSPVGNQAFTIIDNDGTLDAVTGTFNGYNEGATVAIGGDNFTISYAGGDGNDVTLTRQVPAAPTVTGVTLSDGTGLPVTHRSQVRQIIVTFSESVNFTGVVASAFTVHRAGNSILDGNPIGDVLLKASPPSGPASAVTITFDAADTTFVENGSIKDGLYNFTIDATNISGTGGALDGDGVGGAGGNYTVTGSIANKWFRLFGDDNGDGTVNQTDFNAFRLAFLGGPNAEFDFEGDNQVSQSDFNAFRLRFLGSP